MKTFLHLLFIFCLSQCSSTPKPKKPELFTESSKKLALRSLTEKKFQGNLGDIAISNLTGYTLVSSIPDLEQGGKHTLTLLDDSGRVQFQQTQSAPIRNIAISDDGNFIITEQYEAGLKGLNQKGEEIWKTEVNCQPKILNTIQHFVCVHDDDTKPAIAFDIYTFKGQKILTFPSKADILQLKVSADEKWIAIALIGGVVQLISVDPSLKFEVKNEYKVTGEILDVSISNGVNPVIAVLSTSIKTGQLVSFFGTGNSKTTSLLPQSHVEQVELNSNGDKVFLYGNSPKGQNLLAYSTLNSTLIWSKKEPRFADYSLKIDVTDSMVILGIEDEVEGGRRSRVLLLDHEGSKLAEIPIQTNEGAYLYHFNYSRQKSILAVGSDDKMLRLFSIK